MQKLMLPLLGLALLASGAGSIANAQSDPVAVVNGTPISKAVFDAHARQRAARLKGMDSAQARKTLLDELVVQELLLQEAEKQNLAADPQLRLQLEMVRRNLLANAAIRNWLSRQSPSTEALEKEYQAATAGLNAKEYKLRHILVEDENKAKELTAEIQSGADFAELAETHSSDASSVRGGDLGWLDEDSMVPGFAETVTKLEPGNYTERPVQTRFGWHIIFLDEVRDTSPPSLEQLRPQLVQKIQSQLINDYVTKLREAANIEIE